MEDIIKTKMIEELIESLRKIAKDTDCDLDKHTSRSLNQMIDYIEDQLIPKMLNQVQELVSKTSVKSKAEMYGYLRKEYDTDFDDLTVACNEFEGIAQESINIFENNLLKLIKNKFIEN